MPSRIELESIRQNIISDYLSGMTGYEVGDRYGVHSTTVYNYVRRAGLKRRSSAPPKCEVNHTAFATLTEDACYWLGFLLADGCVRAIRSSPQPNLLSVGLAARDRHHLELLRSFLGSTASITDYRPTFSCTFTVCSLPLVADLLRWGIHPRKSLTATVHPDLSDSVPFFRGLVDGDGCLKWISQPNGSLRQSPCLNLTGTREVCQAFADFVHRRITDASKRKPKPRNRARVFSVEWYSQSAAKIAGLLYNGSLPVLHRKAEKATEFASYLAKQEKANQERSLLYSRAEVGRLVGEPHEYLFLWEKAGGVIPGRVGTGYNTGYTRSEVDAWIASGLPVFRRKREPRYCTVPGCTNTYCAKGYCRRCYGQRVVSLKRMISSPFP